MLRKDSPTLPIYTAIKEKAAAGAGGVEDFLTANLLCADKDVRLGRRKNGGG